MSLRGDIENRAIDLLCPLKISEGGYLRALRPYNGINSPDRTNEEFLRVLEGNTPAVLVSTGDGEYDRQTMGRKATLVAPLEFLIVSRNLRSGEDRTRGDLGLSADPGIYQIIEDVWRRIYRRPHTVVGVTDLIPLRDSSVTIAADLTAWLLVFEFRAHVDLEPISDEAGDYTSIRNFSNFPTGDDGEPANPVITHDVPIPS